MRHYSRPEDLPAVIPVFPLPGVILLPRAQLPLNIFEPRYLAMTDYAMAGRRIIGMIQPKAGDESTRRPALSDVGCAGRVTSYSEMPDGRYEITLTGIVRFRVAAEVDAMTPFRQVEADYQSYAVDFAPADPSIDIARGRLLSALRPYLDVRRMDTDWTSLKDAPVEALISALSMICPFEANEKQALLEAPGTRERAEALIALLEIANAAATAGTGSGGGRPVN
jgi:Lon protease-like protein